MEKPTYTLIDYVKWIGDFTFEEFPFCETDALVLCDVIYFDIFNGINATEKSLAELIHKAPVEKSDIVKCLGGGVKRHVSFIRAVESSKRFGTISLQDYSETLDFSNSIQFAAAAFSYKSIWNFIAFRGTDDTIPGWKEDFMISFTKTNAQKLALDFAVKNIKSDVSNYLGGHSKGGNLAMYAAALLPEELLKNVAHIYDLDGPGFCDEIFDLSALDRIRAKTTCVIPEFSVIGKLFSPEFPDTRIVASDETSVMQHELLSWGVKGKELDTVPENDPRSKNINRIIDEWVENIPLDDRKTFVNELFDALASNKARTMTDIMKNGPDGFEEILLQVVGSSPVTKKTAAKLPEQALFGDIFKNLKITGFWNALSRFGIVQSVIMVIAGLMFIFASDNILNVASMMLITGLALTQLGLTFKRFRESHWKFTMVRDRFHLSIIMIVLSIFMLIKEQAMFLFGSIIFANAAFIIAVHSGTKAADKKNPVHLRILTGAESVLCLIYGVSFLIIPPSAVFGYSISIGNTLIADALIRLLFAIYDFLRRNK